MSTFKLEIKTDNAAFGEGAGELAEELARILKTLSEKLTEAAYREDMDGILDSGIGLRDSNGNFVGRAGFRDL